MASNENKNSILEPAFFILLPIAIFIDTVNIVIKIIEIITTVGIDISYISWITTGIALVIIGGTLTFDTAIKAAAEESEEIESEKAQAEESIEEEDAEEEILAEENFGEVGLEENLESPAEEKTEEETPEEKNYSIKESEKNPERKKTMNHSFIVTKAAKIGKTKMIGRALTSPKVQEMILKISAVSAADVMPWIGLIPWWTITVIVYFNVDWKKILIVGATSFFMIPMILLAPFAGNNSSVSSGSGTCFPLKNYKGEVVDADGTEGGFGGPRSSHKHAGIDLDLPKGLCPFRENASSAPEDCKVYAVKDGKVLSTGPFYEGTDFLLIDHGDFVINYGEVFPLVNPEEPVTGGEHIANVIRNTRPPHYYAMIHFELYKPGITSTIQWPTSMPSPPEGLLNPREFLINLFNNSPSTCAYEN